MAELNLRLDLSFGSRSLRFFVVAGMLLSAATEVASESVTLSTYYPAPSGVYAQMITTGNTYLARDTVSNAGMVGIGTTTPATLFNVVNPPGRAGFSSWGAIIQSGTAATYLSDDKGFGAWINAGGSASAATFALSVSKDLVSYLYVRGDGAVGIGTATPASTLSVNGGIQVGFDASCTAAKAGTLRWNEVPGDVRLENCDGVQWFAVNAAEVYGYYEKNATLGTCVISNLRTGGCSCPLPVPGGPVPVPMLHFTTTNGAGQTLNYFNCGM